MNALPAGREPPPGQKATDAISKTLAEVNPGEMQRVMADMKALVTAQPEQARQLLTDRPQLAYALFQAMLLLNIVDPSVLQRIQPLPGQNPGNPTAPAWGGAPPAGGYPPFPASGAAAPPPAAAPAAGGYPPYPPAPAGGGYGRPPPPQNYPPQQQGYGGAAGGYGGPPPPPAAAAGPPPLPPATQAALAGLPEDQKVRLSASDMASSANSQQMLVQVLQLTQDQINALDPAQQASVKQLVSLFESDVN